MIFLVGKPAKVQGNFLRLVIVSNSRHIGDYLF